MKALVLESNGRLVYTESHPDAQAPPRGLGTDRCVRVKIAACGICGSDIPRAFEGKAYHTPLVLGHEMSGVVDEDGAAVRRGDRVAIFPLVPMPGEPLVDSGDYAQTSGYDYYGSRRDGGMADHLVVPEINLFPVPDEVNLVHAACTEPAAVAMHAVRKLHLSVGDDAVVFGAGPIGLMAAQWLRLGGCSPVRVVDVDERKLAAARDLGFDAVAGGSGAVIEPAAKVVEAVGLPSTFAQALAAARAFGEVVFLGNIHGEFRLGEQEFSSLLRREITIYGTWNSKVVPRGSDDWTTALKLMPELGLEKMISHTPLLEEGPAMFAAIHSRSAWTHKVVFRVNPELCS